MVDKGRFSEKLNFKYKTEYIHTVDGKLTPQAKPKIEVVFRRFSESKDPEKNREFRVPALIDSGADVSFLPLKIANLLRLDIDEADEKILTISGEAHVFTSKVYVEIPRTGMRPVSIGTIDVHIMQKEVDEKYLYKLIILGRRGFFDKFKITFNESAKYITLQNIHKDEIAIRK